MYVASDYFLSDEATVEINRGDAVHTDVHILIRDANGSFQISAFMSYSEAQALIGTYFRTTNHSRMMFGDFTVYDDLGGKIDDLKFALEMM